MSEARGIPKEFDPKSDGIAVEYDLDHHIHQLLLAEPFFARVSRYVTKIATYAIPTLAVRINRGTLNFEMIYNPKFFAELKNDDERRSVIMHEFYHIALAHCTSRHQLGINPKLQNIAMDLAINGLPIMIDILPDMACIPGRNHFAEFPPEMAFEWYLARMIQDIKEQDKGNGGEGEGEPSEGGGSGKPGEGIEGQGTLDDHSGWSDVKDKDGNQIGQGKIDDNLKEIAEQKMRDVIQKSANECDQQSNQWGSVSATMRGEIRKAFDHKLDPKVLFRHFCNASIRSSKKHRITKINKRWAYVHPGRVWERRANIAIAIDQSGSVSDEMLNTVYGWMNDLAALVDFTVIPFDSAVGEDKIFVWKKGEKRKRERVLCGGTCFQAPTNYINKKGKHIDGLVVFTDMQAPKPSRCNVKRIWVTSKRYSSNKECAGTEKVLVID